MASPYEVEVKLFSANNLKNVNWLNGPNCPYVVVWVDPTQKRSTNVDQNGDTNPNWDEKLLIPLPPSTSVNDYVLFIDVLHSEPNDKPLIIGSAQLPLNEVQTDGSSVKRTLNLKRPSGRPQGTVDIKVSIKNTGYGIPYGGPQPTTGYTTPAPYGNTYDTGVNVTVGGVGAPYNVGPPPTGYPAAAPVPPPYGYSQSGQQGYGQSGPSVNVTVGTTVVPEKNQQNYGYNQSGQQGSGYGQNGPTVNVTVGGTTSDKISGQPNYGYGQSGQQGYGSGQSGSTVNVGGTMQEKKSSMFGMGTGLVMGAVVGGLGALALEKGIDKVEDKIADRAAEKVEKDMYEYNYVEPATVQKVQYEYYEEYNDEY